MCEKEWKAKLEKDMTAYMKVEIPKTATELHMLDVAALRKLHTNFVGTTCVATQIQKKYTMQKKEMFTTVSAHPKP